MMAMRARAGRTIGGHGWQAWRLRSALLVVVAGLAFAPGAGAAESWFAAQVRGTVLSLENGQWSELPTGGPVGLGVPVRTLQSGRVELASDSVRLTLAPSTALQIEQAAGSTTVVTQYAGVVTVDGNIADGARLVLATPSMNVTVEPGYAVLRVDGDAGTVAVDAGTVILDNTQTGERRQVAVGQAVNVANLDTPVPAGVVAASAGNGAAGGRNPNAANPAGGNSGGTNNAGGNAGGNGNSGGNGNAGGNSGGGNAGGNSGGGNAGGNGGGSGNSSNNSGNSSSSEASSDTGGNGNAGGNGNGNGNGNDK
jgi:hypothetical protein